MAVEEEEEKKASRVICPSSALGTMNPTPLARTHLNQGPDLRKHFFSTFVNLGPLRHLGLSRVNDPFGIFIQLGNLFFLSRVSRSNKKGSVVALNGDIEIFFGSTDHLLTFVID